MASLQYFLPSHTTNLILLVLKRYIQEIISDNINRRAWTSRKQTPAVRNRNQSQKSSTRQSPVLEASTMNIPTQTSSAMAMTSVASAASASASAMAMDMGGGGQCKISVRSYLTQDLDHTTDNFNRCFGTGTLSTHVRSALQAASLEFLTEPLLQASYHPNGVSPQQA